MIKLGSVEIIALAVLFSSYSHRQEQPTQGIILGQKEPVSAHIGNSSFTCPAKFDTGADTSSMHADDILYDKKNQTVSFKIAGQKFTETVIRNSKIKTKNERPVVKMKIAIEGFPPVETDVNLTDRGGFTRPLLIGVNTMTKLGVIVDPSRSVGHKKNGRSNCSSKNLYALQY